MRKRGVVSEYKARGAFFRTEKETFMGTLWNFILEAKGELAKVNWPSRETLLRYTILVIVISALVAAFLGTLDSFFSFLVNRFLLEI